MSLLPDHIKTRFPRKVKRVLQAEGWRGTLWGRPTERSRRFLLRAFRFALSK